MDFWRSLSSFIIAKPGTQTDRRPSHYWFAAVSVAAIVAALVAAIVYMRFGHSHREPHPASFATCATVACREYGDMISTNMDKTVKPCDNFYDFVCGNEIRNPNWQSVYFDHMMAFIQSSAISLRNLVAPKENQTAAQKAARLYQTCEGVTKGRSDEFHRFKDILNRTGVEWPRRCQRPDIFKTSVLIQKAFDISVLITLRSFVTNETVVVLAPGDVMGTYSEQRDLRLKRGWYEEYFNAFKTVFKEPDDDEASLLNFDQFSHTERTVLAELWGKGDGNVTILNSTSELATRIWKIPKGRWDTVMKQELGIPDSLPLHIHVRSIAYIGAFSSLLASIGEQELVLYVGWVTIQLFAPFMNRQLASLWYGSTRDADDVTSTRCAELTERYLGWATWLPRVNAIFTADVRKDIHGVINTLQASVEEKLRNNGWVIGDNRIPRFELIHNTMELVDMPRKRIEWMYANVSDMGDFVSENLVNAVRSQERTGWEVQGLIKTFYTKTLYYNINLFRAVYQIPPFAATLPMYDYNVTKGVNYGALGSMLAAPFFAFLYDSLTKQALKLFQCYLDKVPLLTLGPQYYDRTVSFSILWDAYQAAKGSEKDTRLHGFTEYTEDQVFLIAFCHMLCGVEKEAVHFCNEPLRNSAKFAESFHCPKGSHMNPEARCTFL